MKAVKRFLYRRLPLDKYLRVLSFGFFAGFGLRLGRRSTTYEYVWLLRRMVRSGDTAIDLGANLGYYSRELSRLVGAEGKVYAVEPVAPVLDVLRRNLRGCRNVDVLPFALGDTDGTVTMVNDCDEGYMGSGRNRVSPLRQAQGSDRGDEPALSVPELVEGIAPLTFEVEMRRGSEIFGELDRLDFVKCDVEGYELVILTEMHDVIERHRPACLVETCGANRRKVIELFGSLGYAGYVLEKGELVSVMTARGEKDIVFLAGKICG